MARHGEGLLACSCAMALVAACQSVPVSTASTAVGFRLIVDNGLATLTGRVQVPAGLVSKSGSLYRVQDATSSAGQLALAARPVASATVDLVDNHGNVLDGTHAVQTDDKGWFVLRGARIGEAAFVRVAFAGVDGKTHFEYTYVRPVAAAACLAVDLPTTLVAEAIARKQDLYPVYDPAKIEPIYTKIAAALPETLAGLAPGTTFATPDAAASGAAVADGSATAPTLDPTIIQQALSDATAVGAPAGDGQKHPAFDTFFDQILAPVQADLDKATDTFLQVTFSVQDFGTNVGVPRDLEAAQHLLIGQAEVMSTPTDNWSGVTFWLNNTKMGEATSDGKLWSARVDSATLPDGPYVLTAVARSKTVDVGAVSTKAFLYVLNNLPPGDHGNCGP